MKEKINKKAVVLCSGGLDSTTVLHVALDEGYEVYPISFNYKQRHSIELSFVKQTLTNLGLLGRWKIFELDFTQIQASALTNHALDLPKNRAPEEMDGEIPISYVPLRNTIFLSYAAAYAEANGVQDIFIGVNVLDYSGYPDCRPEYIRSIEEALSRGSRYVDDAEKSFKIHTPLINKTKKEIIELGMKLGVAYDLTWSCYNPKVANERIIPCEECDSCILRAKGFAEFNE